MSDPLDSSAWQLLRDHFDRLEPLDAQAREAELARLESYDPQLGRRLRSMLDVDSDTGLGALGVRPSLEDLQLTGTTVDGFRVGERIGYGGMGVVFSARQLEPDRQVAFKTLRSSDGGSQGAQRVLREARLLGSLSHASVAQVYASGLVEVDGVSVPWFAMEYVEGARPLLDFATHRGLGAGARLELLLQAARGMEHVHARGVVHRDLKSSNVLVNGTGAVKVIDFGVAQARSIESAEAQLTRTGDVLGSLGAMPPEQARGAAAEVGPASDVYALGVLLYELLCGVPPLPLDGLDLLEAAERLQHEPIRRPLEAEQAFGPDARWVLVKALEKRPEDRYPDAGALGRDLERLAERRAVEAGPPTRVYRLQSYVRRNQGLVTALSLVLLSLLVGVAGVTFGLFRARASAERAESDRDQVFQLVAGRSLAQLLEDQAELWPPVPATLEAMEQWSSRARALLERVPELAASAAEVRARGGAGGDVFDPVLGQRPLDWLGGELEQLLEGLERFGDLDSSPLGSALGPPFGWGVEHRIETARALVAASDANRSAWRALEQRCAERGDVLPERLDRAPDLLPLGPDAHSGLEEFALLTSGAAPRRDSAGRLAIDAESALVFVAVPAGTWWTGMQFTDPGEQGYVDRFLRRSGYPRARPLDAFLISKYEVSNAQWQRLGAVNTADQPDLAHFRPGPLRPVESSSNAEVVRVLERFGLRLPTILEWEVAARGGTETRWWFGDDPTQAQAHANLADASLKAAGWQETEASVGFAGDDGYAMAAPIDALSANPFGLHHVIGNVEEWVRLRFAVDGAGTPGSPTIIERPGFASGTYTTRVEDTASARQTEAQASTGEMSVGIRPMRDLPESASATHRR